MLTPAELTRYHEQGIVIPDFRLDRDTIEAIRADHTRLLAKHPEFVDMCPTLLAYDLAFLNYARIEPIVDMVEQILGPDFALWNASFFAKPALKGKRTPWHQDGEYWPIRPIATCTAWIAVDDSTRENGCLRVIPGSHRSRNLYRHQHNTSNDITLSQELSPTEYDEAQAMDVLLEAGQFSLHDVYLVHGSEPNRSPHPRRGMTLRFMPLTSVFDRELAVAQRVDKELNVGLEDRTLFLMRGQDRTGRNDFMLRR